MLTDVEQPAVASFTSIPILDLSFASTPQTKPDLLSQLQHALTNIGFLYIMNHSVPEHIISDLVSVLPALFSLSEETKFTDLGLINSPHFLGYSAVGSETTAGRRDSREQFEFATELPVHPGFGIGHDGPRNVPLYERLKGPNQWPDEKSNITLTGFRDVVERYTAEMTSLGERFLKLVAEALYLPEETLFAFLSEQHRLKLVRYPPAGSQTTNIGQEQKEYIQGVGPHKDSSGWWTFLLQASPPQVKGLQVLNKAGQWIDVPVIKGTFVVNIGQAFEVVTHGVCKATTHRVMLSTLQKEERFSVPFFQGVTGSLTKQEATATLKAHFESWGDEQGGEAIEGREIDSAFLKGGYETWGESQLRTKIRSHRDVGKRWYPEIYEQYVGVDG
ncbi:hypothetical protein V8F20_010949 [Naviculisporaceae sp. PSN 640]